jgi:hypothetical protein
LKEVKRADLLVGIPSFNNERTIGHVVRAVVAGIARHFPEARTVLVNADGGSTDRTREIVEQTDVGDLTEILVDAVPSRPATRIVTPYSGVPGKGSALRTVFRIAAELEVSAACVVDSDLRSITPEWIELLVEPVLKHGFAFVAPLYARHRYDGTITNTIVYPMTRALYGQRVRQPIGGDFGFSGELAGRFLEYGGWDGPVARYGIDIFMTTTALAEKRRVAQAFLGAKIHDPKDPGADLQPMMVQVVSTVFELMERYESTWSQVEGSSPSKVFGFPYTVGLEAVTVKLERLAAIFAQAAEDLPSVWRTFLSGTSLAAIEKAVQKRTAPDLPDKAWVRIVYEAAAGCHHALLPTETLIKSLVPLYLGKVATFVQETRGGSDEDAEARLEELALEYERSKEFLRMVWRGPALNE